MENRGPLHLAVTEVKDIYLSAKMQGEILRCISDGVIVAGLDGKVLYWNKGAEEIYGYNSREMLGHSLSVINPPRLVGEGRNVLNYVKEGKEYIGEWQCCHKDGSTLWVVVRLSALKNREGKMTGIIGISTDITEKVKLERKQKEAQAQVQAIFDNSAKSYYLIGKDYIILNCNWTARKGMIRMMGRALGPGDSYLEMVRPEDLPAVKNRIDRAMAGERIHVELEHRINGRPCWFELSYYPVTVNKSERLGICIVAQEVTERKEKERKLLETEADLRALFENTSKGFIFTNLEGKVLAYNNLGKELLPFAAGRLLEGTWVLSLLPQEMKEAFVYAFGIAAKGTKSSFDCHTELKDGSCRYLEVSFVPVCPDGGEVIGVCIAMSDISDQLEATRQVMEKDRALLETSRELSRTNEELDRFVYSASHEMRTPITTLKGMFNILELECTEQSLLEFLPLMRDVLARLDNTIKDIVQHFQNNRLEANYEEISFPALIRDLLAKFNRIYAKEPVFHLHMQGEDIIITDRLRLSIIMNSLLANAFKFTDPLKKVHTIDVQVKKNNSQLMISVTDNGMGIPGEYHEDIFRMFSRITGEKTGSGLGLYVAREAARKLGGSISMLSVPGEGSTFTVILPRHGLK